MAYALAWLADVLRNAGLTVVEESGWQSRGHGEMKALKGVLCHHTAGPMGGGNSPSLAVVRDGRPPHGSDQGLEGPLAQLFLGRDGTWHTIAAGLSYHAGKGNWPGIGLNAGNEHLIGIEAENTGLLNEPWSERVLDSYARGCAALLKHIGAPAGMCLGHKEYAPGRKTDPSFDMDTFRATVLTHIGTL